MRNAPGTGTVKRDYHATPAGCRGEFKERPLAMECDHCGSCCQSLIIEIEHVDVVREPRLAPPVSELMDGNGKISYDSDWQKQYLLACGRARLCPFHVEDRCAIHPTRPNACVTFEAGSPECQRARYYDKKPPLGRDAWPEDDELAAFIGEDY